MRVQLALKLMLKIFFAVGLKLFFASFFAKKNKDTWMMTKICFVKLRRL
jgi:hypothetical protein